MLMETGEVKTKPRKVKEIHDHVTNTYIPVSKNTLFNS